MQKNNTYILAIAILAIFTLYIVFDGDEEYTQMSLDDDFITNDVQESESFDDEFKQHINIKYSKSNNQQKQKTQTKSQSTTKNQTNEQNPQTPYQGDKKYNISTSTVQAGKFIFRISSNEKISKQNPNSFPMLPAFIKGKIDGVSFSMVIPVDLQNKDLTINIEDTENGEIKTLPYAVHELGSGTNVNIDIDYNNIDNFHVKSKTSTLGPPSPPVPLLPGQTR